MMPHLLFSLVVLPPCRLIHEYVGLSDLLTIGADQCCSGQFEIADEMAQDVELNASIDIIGSHCPGSLNGQRSPNPSVLALNKPLWNTEQHFGIPDPSSLKCWQFQTALDLAQTLNGMYIEAQQTSTQMWTPIYSWYDWLPYAGKGLLVANEPWSQTYNISDTVWAMAHTTQFAQPGWRYGGAEACAAINATVGGKWSGSYVSYLSPDGHDVSVVIETSGATGPTSILLTLEGATLSPVEKLERWTTVEGAVFVHAAPIASSKSAGGTNVFKITVPPRTIWTLTTLATGQSKGVPATEATGKGTPFSFLLPYYDDFESYPLDTLPLYFSDMHGAFAVVMEEGNKAMRQLAGEAPPLCTHGSGATAYATVIGDASWSDYTLSVKASATAAPSSTASSIPFLLIGSHAGGSATLSLKPESFYHAPYTANGVVLRLNMDGTWTLSTKAKLVASGKGGAWSPGKTLAITLTVHASGGEKNTVVSADVDGVDLTKQLSVGEKSQSMFGAAWLGGGFHETTFDDFSITKVSSPFSLGV